MITTETKLTVLGTVVKTSPTPQANHPIMRVEISTVRCRQILNLQHHIPQFWWRLDSFLTSAGANFSKSSRRPRLLWRGPGVSPPAAPAAAPGPAAAGAADDDVVSSPSVVDASLSATS